MDVVESPSSLPPVSADHGIRISIPWRSLVELAQQIEATKRETGEFDAEAALKLANSVLLLQAQLLGRFSGGKIPP